MTVPIVHRFGAGAAAHVKRLLEVDDPICRAVRSALVIERGVAHGFYPRGAEPWLGEEKLESCIPVSRDDLWIGANENRRFIAEYLGAGEPDRVGLFYSVWFDNDSICEGWSGTPYLLARSHGNESKRAVWYFLQGPRVTSDDVDGAFKDAAEWPAICILSRTGLKEALAPGSELGGEVIQTIAENTQFLIVRVFDCGERLIWSKDADAFWGATRWLKDG